MKFQTIIIGGGLSGLMAGIKLAKAHQKVAIVSTGQSSLHFSSGSFELLSHYDGKNIESPIEAIGQLPEKHPYSIIGAQTVATLAEEIPGILSEAGITVKGTSAKNHYRLSPLGKILPAWLTVDDFATFDAATKMPWNIVKLINIDGFLDFYPQFLALELEKLGVTCSMGSFTTPEIEKLRKSTTEMRATNIARTLTDDVVIAMAGKINAMVENADAVIMPEVLGINNSHHVELLRNKVSRPVFFISTMPMSVAGVRMQMQLRDYFVKLGGVYMLGDIVKSGEFENNTLKCLTTENLIDDRLYADNFILASGSFFGHGLKSTPDRVYEPTFGLDVNFNPQRPDWFDKNIYAAQPYMNFGVTADARLHPSLKQQPVGNLYASGAVLGGCDAIKDGCGGGEAMITALHAANMILNSK